MKELSIKEKEMDIKDKTRQLKDFKKNAVEEKRIASKSPCSRVSILESIGKQKPHGATSKAAKLNNIKNQVDNYMSVGGAQT